MLISKLLGCLGKPVLGISLLIVALSYSFNKVKVQAYETDCSIQSTDAYKFGTSTAFSVGSLLFGITPIAIWPGIVGQLVGAVLVQVLRIVWPLIIGASDKC